jgi:hypothetical protein
MCGLGDFAPNDFLQCIDALARGIKGVHKMHLCGFLCGRACGFGGGCLGVFPIAIGAVRGRFCRRYLAAQKERAPCELIFEWIMLNSSFVDLSR